MAISAYFDSQPMPLLCDKIGLGSTLSAEEFEEYVRHR